MKQKDKTALYGVFLMQTHMEIQPHIIRYFFKIYVSVRHHLFDQLPISSMA